MKNRFDSIMSTPLKSKICVEKKFKESDNMADNDYRRLETAFNGFQERFAGFQSEMVTTVNNVKEDIDGLVKVIDKLTDIVNTTYAKVTNGLTDASIRHEKELERKVNRPEFDNALRTIRDEMKATRRLMWGFFSLMITSVVALVLVMIKLKAG